MICVAASAFAKPALAASTFDISGATALERWNLTAKAALDSWEPGAPREAAANLPQFVTRLPFGDLAGDARRASLFFDWQRDLGRDRLALGAFAVHHGVDLRSAGDAPPEAGFGERFGERERRNLFGVQAQWSASHFLGGRAATSRVGVRLRGESLDGEGVIEDAGRGVRRVLHEERLRQAGTAVHFEEELAIARGVRATAGVRLDRYGFDVRTAEAGVASVSGNLAAPRFAVVLQPSADLEVFAAAGRGLRPNDARTPGAAIDPRSGVPLGVLDPAASTSTVEAGLRMRLSAVDMKLAAWRASADAELTLLGAGGSLATQRRTRRDAVQLTMRHEPAAWLTLDFDAALVRARFSDGLREMVPGSGSYGQAGATLRPARGWNASVFVTSFAATPSTSDDPLRARSASFVSGRITHALTRDTRVSLDLFNLLDKRIGTVDYFSATHLWSYPGAADNFLFYPGESRGLRLRLRTTF